METAQSIPADVMSVLQETARFLGISVEAQVANWYAALARAQDRVENERFLGDISDIRRSMTEIVERVADGETARLVREVREERG